MSFIKVKKMVEDEGILYILIFKIDGEKVFKVGMTKRKLEDRVSEILTSFYHKFRYYPYMRPKRFKKVSSVFAKEALMHKALKEFKYVPDHVFSGSTETFSGIEEQLVLDMYDRVLEDKLEGVIDGRIRETTERD